MLKEYIKKTHPFPILCLWLSNLPFFLLNFMFFVTFPLLLRRWYIIGESLANFIKIVFVFCYEFLIVPTSISIFNKLSLSQTVPYKRAYKIKFTFHAFLSSFFYAVFKTNLFILHLILFRLCFAQNKLLAFLELTAFFFVLCFSLYLPHIIAKKIVAHQTELKKLLLSSFKESFKLFTNHPFFSSFIFLQSLLLLFLLPLTLFCYPSMPQILYNLKVAYELLDSRLNC